MKRNICAILILLLCLVALHWQAQAHTPNEALQIVQQGQLGGAIQDVAVQGNYTYISQGTRLAILDTSNVEMPVIIGQTDVLPGRIIDIELAGNYVYITNVEALQIIDVQTPQNPTKIAELTIEGARYVTVANGFAYVSSNNALHIVNVTDPSSPMLTSTYAEAGAFGGIWRSAVQGNLVFVAAGFARGFVILDVSNPAAPTRIGSYPGIPNHATVSVTVDGNYAYSGADGIHVVDITDPTNPVQVGFYDPDVSASPRTLAKSGQYIYGTYSGFGMYIVDVSNPASPVEASVVDIPSGGANDIALQENHAYVAWLGAGLQIVNISDPRNPTQRSRFEQIGNGRSHDLGGEGSSRT